MLSLRNLFAELRRALIAVTGVTVLGLHPADAQVASTNDPGGELARLQEEGARLLFEGRLFRASEIFEERYQILEQRVGAQDTRLALEAAAVGFLKLQANQLSDAERYFLIAANGLENTGNAVFISRVFRALGSVYLRQGRTTLAAQYVERATRILADAGIRNENERALAEIDQAMIAFRDGRFSQAAARFETLIDEFVVEGDRRDVILAYSLHLGLGRAYRGAGNYPAAERAFLAAIAEVDAFVERSEHNNRRIINQIPRFRDLMTSSRAQGICFLGGLYRESGDYGQAARRLEQCIDLARVNDSAAFGELFLGTSDLMRVQLLTDAAPETTAANAQAYLETLNDVRLEQITNREIINRPLGFALYADAAWSIDQQSFAESAFRTLQQSVIGPATSSIAEMAARRAARETSSRLGELAQRRTELVNDISDYSVQQSSSFVSPTGSGAQNREAIADNRARAEAELAQIDASLESEFPDYFALIRPQPLTVAETQSLLEGGEALLLIVPSEFGTHVIAVTADRFAWHRADLTVEAIEDAVRRLRWDLGAQVSATQAEIASWQSDYPANGAFPFDRRTAFTLYRSLVSPVEETIEGSTNLYVVAGGQLAALPLSVLVTENPQGADYDPEALRGTAWLADRYAMSSLPSIQSLQLLRQIEGGGRTEITPDFAGFGDPVLNGAPQPRGFRNLRSGPSSNDILSWTETASRSRMADVSLLSELTRLPGTAVELENIRQALGASRDSIWLGERATETAVRTADLSNARILVFATHGLMPDENLSLAEPGLVFTPPSTATDADDGYLSASEVASLVLDADWVILSACNTATGDDGFGLSSIARSFFYAGARSLLASQWPVGDDVAARLTVRMFEILRDTQGVSRAQAFQLAMREIRLDSSHDNSRTSWAHPAFWAPFTLIGIGS